MNVCQLRQVNIPQDVREDLPLLAVLSGVIFKLIIIIKQNKNTTTKKLITKEPFRNTQVGTIVVQVSCGFLG